MKTKIAIRADMRLLGRITKLAGALLSLLLATACLPAQGKLLSGHVPDVVPTLQPLGELNASKRLDLVIGLPLRNPDVLTNLIRELYDPASANFHHYLTPEQFTEQFGPTEADYQAVLQFAAANGFTVTSTYTHREMINVSASVSDIERTFHTHLRMYQHPTEPRQFFAPDVEPSVDDLMPIHSISGLSDYRPAISFAHRQPPGSKEYPVGGTGPNGNTYRGYDFRTAYAPGVTLTGAGQSVGLLELDGYYASDIGTYENQAGLPDVPITVFPLAGSSSFPTGNTNAVAEVSLDMEMAIAMAPGMDRLYVFEANNFDTVLGSMVTNSQIKQFSSSWGNSGFDSTGETFLKQMAAQGQTFFQASGDGDAYTQVIPVPSDDVYVTSVGGTALSMATNASQYTSETVWNSGFQAQAWYGNGAYTLHGVAGGYWGSGGGVSTITIFPTYQQGVNMVALGGSTTKRDIPDVALTGLNVYVNYFNGLSGGFEGTSCAAPLWAGFAALINEQAALDGKPPIGFINPALYAIGESGGFAFHDITNGSDTWPNSPNLFVAGPGYDLCTGWGTPNGLNTIRAIEYYGGPVFVDFNYTGSTQDGTYFTPYKTIGNGVNAVGNNGIILIETTGSTTETPTISKPMTITTLGGATATIGR